MKLKTLMGTLKSGNLSLGSKLSNLLTEDCVILEYTNDSVLFIKDNKLVEAKFKTPLTEHMTSDHIIDNEVITVSAKELSKELKNRLKSVVEGVATGNLVSAEQHLNEFCETYYQFSSLKRNYPEIFVENLSKNNRGFSIRKKASTQIPNFKSAIFNCVVVEESVSNNDLKSLVSVVENHGIVLALGRDKVKTVLTDALLGNHMLAESLATYLYTIVEELSDANPELEELTNNSYDLEQGKYPDESPEQEDYTDEYPEDDIPSEEEVEDAVPEFEPFDPATLSEEEIKELHKATLKGILSSIRDFVREKANDPNNTQIPADLDGKIDRDLEAFDDPDLSDARLSEIEARWQPSISYFLDSEYHTPSDMANDFTDESDIDSTVAGNDESEDISNVDTEADMTPEEPANNLTEEPSEEDSLNKV